MDAPPWFVRHKTMLRLAMLALLIVSLLGPWMYDVIHVPAEYTCDNPFVRLEGDFCGYSLSGFFMLYMFTSGLFYMIIEWIKGNFAGRAREFIISISVLIIIIPFFSTLLLIWKKDSRRLQTINLVAWGSGCILPLLILILEWNVQTIHLWGLWFYILAAVSALTVEMLIQKWKVKGADRM